MTIGQTRFWIDRTERSIGIRSSSRKTQPFELSVSRYWKLLPSFYFYEDDDDFVELRLSARWLWFSLNMIICFLEGSEVTGSRTFDDRRREWGWHLVDTGFHVSWGHWSWWTDLPFVTRLFVKHELLSLDGNIVHDTTNDHKKPGEWERRKAIVAKNSVSVPYRYTTNRGEVQDVIAKVNIERYTRRWKWTPFLQVENCIHVEFSEEVGSERGSWKGGCVGCGYDMKPGETAIETLRRMERERRFER